MIKPQKTVDAAELSFLRMVAGNENKYDRVIDEGVVKQWVGFGWVAEGPPDPIDVESCPVVVRAT